MTTNNPLLLHKEAFSFTIAFIKGNWNLFFKTYLILLLLFLILNIPLINVPFFFVTTIFIINIKVYIARVFLNSSPSEIEDISKNLSLYDLLTEYGNISGAIILANAIIILVLKGIFSLLKDVSFIYQIVLVTKIFLGYIYPIVISYAIHSEDFKSAFLTVFQMFNPYFWINSFNIVYIPFIFLWIMISLLFNIPFIFFFKTIFIILIIPLITYIQTLYNGVVLTIIKNISKGK